MEKPKHQLVMDKSISDEIDNDIRQRTFEIQLIPSSKLFDVELDGISNKIKEIKLSNKSIDFVNKIKSVLSLFNPDDNKYNHNIVLFAAQAVENYFIGKRKMGETKLKLVKEACKDYFNGEEELVEMVVDLVLPKLKTSRLYKLKIFFLKIFGMLV